MNTLSIPCNVFSFRKNYAFILIILLNAVSTVYAYSQVGVKRNWTLPFTGQSIFDESGTLAYTWNSEGFSIRNVSDNSVRKSISTPINLLSISTNGSVVCTVTDSTLHFWNGRTGEFINTLKISNSKISSVVLNTNNTVYILQDDNSIKLWDFTNGKLLGSFSTNYVKKVLTTPSNNFVITVHYNNSQHWVKVWSATGDSIYSTELCFTTVSVKQNRSNDLTTFICDANDLTILNPATKQIVERNTFQQSKILSFDFDYSGSYYAIATEDSCSIKSLLNGKKVNMYLPQKHIYKAIFDPSGKKVLTNSLDSTIRIWNAYDGNLNLTIKGNTNYYNTKFNTDGSLIHAITDYKDVVVFNVSTAQQLTILHDSLNLPDYQNSFLFSQDSIVVITYNTSNISYKVWNYHTKALQYVQDNFNGINH
ncbi:MAG: hypothetical protein JNJ85_01770, partial [Candidatus Kapabacteria bacterium]|nr:hypothetical protein [Candidatus Kapabacteria bacterium]